MKILNFIIITFFCIKIYSQSPYGISLSGNGGIKAIEFNPANLAASPFRTYFELINLNFGINNNLLSTKELIDLSEIDFKKINSSFLADSAFAYRVGQESNKKYDIDLNINSNLFSFLIGFGRHHSLAITSQIRSFTQIGDLDINSIFFNPSQNINNYLSNGLVVNINNNTLSSETKFNTNIDFKNLFIRSNNFIQFGFHYGFNLIEKKDHTLKVGLGFKLIKGLVFATANSNNAKISMTLDYPNAKSTTSGNFELINTQFENNNSKISNISDFISTFIFNNKNNGWGLDIGAVYEWNPGDKNKEKMSYDAYANPYKLKLGFSIIDLGSIGYQTEKNALIFLGNTVSFNAINQDSIKYMTPSNIDTLSKRWGIKQEKSTQTTSVSLPTMIHLNADYKLYGKLYVAANLALNASNMIGNYANPIPTNFVIAPRLQTKVFELAMPMTYIPKYSQLKIGGYIRLFGLFLGVNDFSEILQGLNKTYGSNLYCGLRYGFYKHKSTLKKYYNQRYGLNETDNNDIPSKTVPPTMIKDTAKQTNKTKMAAARERIDSLQKVFQKDTLSKIKSRLIDKTFDSIKIDRMIPKTDSLFIKKDTSSSVKNKLTDTINQKSMQENLQDNLTPIQKNSLQDSLQKKPLLNHLNYPSINKEYWVYQSKKLNFNKNKNFH